MLFFICFPFLCFEPFSGLKHIFTFLRPLFMKKNRLKTAPALDVISFRKLSVCCEKGMRHCVALPYFRNVCLSSFRQIEADDVLMQGHFYAGALNDITQLPQPVELACFYKCFRHWHMLKSSHSVSNCCSISFLYQETGLHM